MSGVSAMPTSASHSEALVDTSVAVALVVADHQHHASTATAVGRRRLGLAGHAAFETYSVLTRLPAPLRRRPEVVAELLATGFPGTKYLSVPGHRSLLDRLASSQLGGGSVYDALVGAAAAEHGLPLLTRDRRAADTYRAIDVAVELLTG
jgi:predicted nucleic acid-binding protein